MLRICRCVSAWKPIARGVLQSSAPSPLFFLMHTNDIVSFVKYGILSSFTDDVKTVHFSYSRSTHFYRPLVNIVFLGRCSSRTQKAIYKHYLPPTTLNCGILTVTIIPASETPDFPVSLHLIYLNKRRTEQLGLRKLMFCGVKTNSGRASLI